MEAPEGCYVPKRYAFLKPTLCGEDGQGDPGRAVGEGGEELDRVLAAVTDFPQLRV